MTTLQGVKYQQDVNESTMAVTSATGLDRCECGHGDMILLQSGKRICSDTLMRFEIQHGRPYDLL